MKQRKTICAAICMLTLLLVLTVPCLAGNNVTWLSDPQAFLNELKRGTPVLYVDDLIFPEETTVLLNYDVQIIGKEESSTIANAHFSLRGSNTSGESVTVSVENVIFDGLVNKSDYPFEQEKLSFEQMFGDERETKRCFEGTWGYFDLNLTNCEITRYASFEGPAIFVNNEVFDAGTRTVTLKDCSIHDNLCFEGTVKMWYEKGIYTIENCDFSHNTAKSAAGMILSNGKILVTDTRVCDNELYRFFVERYPEDRLVIEKIGRDFPTCNSSGALFIGGADATVRGCTITGNQGVYGGGVGIVSPEAVPHGEKVEFIDCVIADNTALLAGGGIFVCSYTGQTVRFLNCLITGNSAPSGGVLYTYPLAPYFPDSVGGTVELAFCTVAENTDEDGSSFVYHDLIREEAAGNIELYGCIVIDNATEITGTDNYVAIREQAIADHVVTERSLENLSENGLRPLAGSAADVTVPAETYSLWAESFGQATEPRAIGAVLEEENGTGGLYWLIAIPVAAGGVFAYGKLRRKKQPVPEEASAEASQEPEIAEENAAADYSDIPQEELISLISEKFGDKGLTRKELQVAALLLVCEKRKEIADRMFVSEDTVKTHISHIFKKTGVASRQEFRDRMEQ